MSWRLPLLHALLVPAACSQIEGTGQPVETVVLAPLQLDVEAIGQVRAVRSTPLLVPGRNWVRQQLTWLAPDGSAVREGDIVARFSAAQGELNLSEAMLELQRTALSRETKQDSLEAAVSRIGVDLAQVGSELAIASRYADADLSMFARNDILDAIEDQRFLDTKDSILRWRRDQASERGAAELAVIDSQRASFERTAELRRQDLASLELIAPHDGVFVLKADWSGEKPSVGSTIWSQNELGSLPDTGSLQVEILVPQVDSHAMAEGVKVSVHPLGNPDETVHSALDFVAATAQVKSRDTPVRYLTVRAPIPAEAARRHGWVPGQAMRVVLHLGDGEPGLSVPNTALRAAGTDQGEVMVMAGGKPQPRQLRLGVRGPARTQVLDGLTPGEQVLLLPDSTPATRAETEENG